MTTAAERALPVFSCWFFSCTPPAPPSCLCLFPLSYHRSFIPPFSPGSPVLSISNSPLFIFFLSFFFLARINISFSFPQLHGVISVTPGNVRCHLHADCSAARNRSVRTGRPLMMGARQSCAHFQSQTHCSHTSALLCRR